MSGPLQKPSQRSTQVCPLGQPKGQTEQAGDPKKLTRDRYNPAKCANPFQANAKKCKSSFSQGYVNGNIPCRLQTTTSKFSLQWDSFAQTGFSADLLLVCADGLVEDEHPYVVMAPLMFDDLVRRSEGVADMFVPIADPIALSLRKAFLVESAVSRACAALKLLLEYAGPVFSVHLPKLVPAISKWFRDRRFKDDVLACLGAMEQHCGPEATKLIKSKIPTY